MAGERNLLVWEDAVYQTGEFTIDTQHKDLFRRINWIIQAPDDPGKSANKILDMLNFLERYVIQHFDYEEREMDNSGHPLAALNRSEHIKFKEMFGRMKEQYSRFGVTPQFHQDLQTTLVEWTRDHIRDIDAKFQWKKWAIQQ